MKNKTQRFITVLFGENAHFKLKHRLFNFTLFLNLIVSFTLLIENLYMNNHIVTIIFTSGNFITSAVMYYYSRKKFYYRLPVWINLILDLFIITPFVWIFNGGTSGGSQYFVILFCMMITAFMKGKTRIILQLVYFAVILILIMTEYYHPEIIVNYQSDLNRYQDVAFSMFVMLITAVVVFSIYIYAYEDEHLKVKKYSEEIEIERNKLKEKDRLLEIELKLAKNIQAQFIPVKSPVPFIDFFIQPVAMVGGDFLDIIIFKDSDDIGIFISDVSGHGVPAALITAMIKSNLDENGVKVQSTNELMSILNDNLYNLTDGNYITCFYGIYRKDKRELIYTNAGHNSPYVITQKKVEELNTSMRSIPLAILNNDDLEISNKRYRENRVVLEKGSKVLFYTDGLIETRNINLKKSNEPARTFNSEILVSLLSGNHHLPASEFIKKITEELIVFRGSNDFEDDICIVCLDVG